MQLTRPALQRLARDTSELCCRLTHVVQRTTKAMHQLLGRDDTGIKTSTAGTRIDWTNQQQITALRWPLASVRQQVQILNEHCSIQLQCCQRIQTCWLMDAPGCTPMRHVETQTVEAPCTMYTTESSPYPPLLCKYC